MTSPLYKFAELKPIVNHEMSTSETGYDWYKSESHIKPVDEIKIKLDYKVGYLEDELLFEKTNTLNAQQANEKLEKENREWEVKFKNLEFANRNLQAQVDKIPTLKRTIKFMMAEHLDIELGDE